MNLRKITRALDKSQALVIIKANYYLIDIYKMFRQASLMIWMRKSIQESKNIYKIKH